MLKITFWRRTKKISTILCLPESMWQHMMGQSVQDPDTAIQRCFPERPNEPDCLYYIRTGQCAYAMDCKFNHPSNRKLVLLNSSLNQSMIHY